MRWSGLSRNAGNRVRVGRRTISVPSVPSMTAPEGPTGASGPATGADRPPLIDRKLVQYLDRVRAIFRPTRSNALASGLKRFIGREDIFRHVGMADMGSDGTQPMMQLPAVLARRNDRGADPRSGGTRDTGRPGRSSGLMARKPKAGERVKVGRWLLVLPGVRSMTDPDPVALATKPGDIEPNKPTDELNEELT